MTYIDAWKPIASRVHGLNKAATLNAQFLAIRDSDSYGAYKRLHAQCVEVVKSIKHFHGQFASTLPTVANDAIARLVPYAESLSGENLGITKGVIEEMGKALLITLTAFESELSYHLTNQTEALRSRCEVAFEHLRRLIVVDEDIRNKWQRAYADGEVACERLGAVHLLLHEIWAFKINAEGARTDLVFPEPPRPIGALTGLVLTEWKIATARAQDKYEEAFGQAKAYSEGALAATELATHRYLVVVSEMAIDVPEDRIDSGIVYRHINIPVQPDTPSKAVRRKTSSGK